MTGEGEVVAMPDIGSFSFTVNESGTDASLALESSGTKVNEVIAALEAAGVEKKTLKLKAIIFLQNISMNLDRVQLAHFVHKNKSKMALKSVRRLW